MLLEIGNFEFQKIDYLSSLGLDPGNIEHLPFVWHKGKDFRKTNNKTIPLIYRMATVEDKKGANPAKSSRHLWLKGQRKLKVMPCNYCLF